MSLNKSKLQEVFEEANSKFWEAVADSFPEIKTGDMSPASSSKIENAMKKAIQDWYEGNLPVESKKASEIIRNLQMRIARLERLS